MAVDGHPVVLLTFAGRRDRMDLLTHYVREALRRGLIDEWHVWNFSRNDDDDRWLKSQFPVIGRTPDDLVYYPAGCLDTNWDDQRNWRARIRARNDVHIGIRPRYGGQASYELVVGGWANQRTVLRRLDTSEFLVEDRVRETGRDPVAAVETPSILSAVSFRGVEVSVDTSGIGLSVDGSTIIEYRADVTPGKYDIYVKTGYGAEGEWRFPDRPDIKEYLYQSTKRSSAGWSELFNFYADRAAHYADAVIMKCDDDIVYLQLDTLEEFIRFRLRERGYFLVSANVVNNGVCAFHQQRRGVIPESLMKIDWLPNGGAPGLRNSGARAMDLHNYFLDNRGLFEQMPAEPIPWRGRTGINFVSWIGRDMSYMSAEMADDEYAVCVQIPGYLQRSNCLFPKFLVSHLTFRTQDEGFDHDTILGRYRQLTVGRHMAEPEVSGVR